VSENGRPTYTLIRDLPPSERPRERLRDYGAGALSDAELIAILLRTGSARMSALAQASALIAKYEGLAGLARASFADLLGEHGLGEAKAAQLRAALELGLRLTSAGAGPRDYVRTPDDVLRLMGAEMSLLSHEEVRLIVLTTKNAIVSKDTVYRGSVHTTSVRIVELLKDAVKTGAPAIVVVHNHPSGDPTPSAADATMTRNLYDACKLMDIELMDHIVIGGGEYVSLRAQKLGFPA